MPMVTTSENALPPASNVPDVVNENRDNDDASHEDTAEVCHKNVNHLIKESESNDHTDVVPSSPEVLPHYTGCSSVP